MTDAALQIAPHLDDLEVSDLGTISIRVFVLPPKRRKGVGQETVLPADMDEGEAVLFEQSGATPIASYLESNRGRRCIVFLVNGQRQDFLDNSFIVQELGFKYLRSRMMIIVDVDGLAPEAIGKMMQGSRQGFYKGQIYDAIIKRIVATLKNDPELIRLEEEAEQAVSELSAGDEKVKQTLDRLIESHHNFGHDFAEGSGLAGESKDSDELGFRKVIEDGVVTLLPPTTGEAADYPVLFTGSRTIRLIPKTPRSIVVKTIPSGHWSAIAELNVQADPSVPELFAHVDTLEDNAKIKLHFNPPGAFDDDQYPVRAQLKVTARFNGITELRQLELTVLTNPDVPPPEPELFDPPTRLKVSSREPISVKLGDGDTHVKLRWDGKDELLLGDKPKWRMVAELISHPSSQPNMSFSEPRGGRLSLLITPRPEWVIGQRLKFEVTAIGPADQKLFKRFEAEVVARPESPDVRPEPRLVKSDVNKGQARKPPYDLKFINRDSYGQPCWDLDEWSDECPGAFLASTERTPLTLIINEDMGVLRDYRAAITKRNTEQDVERKINKYTSHIAFHLYQMYQATEGKKDEDVDAADALRREEIRRVAMTMIKLMDVAVK